VSPFCATLQANARATAMQRDYLLSVNPDRGLPPAVCCAVIVFEELV
jgi:hypothetical protein